MPVKAFHEPYLLEAVQSMLDQTNPDWRLLIVVEQAEWDDVQAVLADHLTDTRIEMVRGQRPGLAAQFNVGMQAADSDFVAILLGDDVWAPNAVEVLARNRAAHPDVDFFHSARQAMDADRRPLSSVMPARERISLDDFRTASPIKHLLCWRRELGLAIGGMDESLKSIGVDDYDFTWSMAEAGATFKAIQECLYIYRDHREHFRLTTHMPLNHHKRELARILRKHGLDRATVRAQVAKAEQGYLRQCLYRSRLDRWIKQRRGFDPESGWREQYP